jgi:DNA-binding NarL/FixJ family response regulator
MAETLRATGKYVEHSSHMYRTGDDQGESSIQVLVVDDYHPFRRYVCSMLKEIRELQVVGEAADGLEAVNKAGELRPDLVLMDVGLPEMNGIEAARQIRKLAPECEIVFLSLESSADVITEALDQGALRYILKERIGSELLPVVEAVILNKLLVRKNAKNAKSSELRY